MGKKLLVIDDNEQDFFVLNRALAKAGYNDVVFALGGYEGIEKAKVNKPDLIIMDIRMPQIGGVDIYNILKGLPAYKETPIIFYTSMIKPGEIDEAKDRIFAKSTFPVEMIKTINELLIEKDHNEQKNTPH